MELKTINDFYAEMLAAKQAQSALDGLDSVSKVSVWRLLFYIAAVAAWSLQALVSGHLTEIASIIADTKPGVVRWYRYMALNFQYGQSLVTDDIVYDNTGLTEEQIAEKKVVKHCATSGKLRGVRVKVAGEDGTGELAPLTVPQAEALLAYLEQIKSPGVRIYLINQPADLLKLGITIYYDPLVLAADGKRLDGTSNTPVEDAINDFLKQMPFDGLFTLMQLTDALQLVSGVEIPQLNDVQASYASLNYMPITLSYLADSGYLRLNELSVTYLPFSSL